MKVWGSEEAGGGIFITPPHYLSVWGHLRVGKMNLLKEIKENKWGIIIGGVWGMISLIYFFKIADAGITYLDWIIVLPVVIGTFIGIFVKEHLIRLHPDFFLFPFLSPFIGSIFGYGINKILNIGKERLLRKCGNSE